MTTENPDLTDTLITSVVPPGQTLMPFQYSGIRALASKSRFLIASDAGVGKTVMLVTAVNTVSKYYTPDRQLNVLVLCPKSMLHTWEREANKWNTCNATYEFHNQSPHPKRER